MGPAPRDYAATFLVSCSLILLQVSFTRLIGYKLYYHFVFLAISLALLGLGAAGSWLAVRPPGEAIERSLRRWLAALLISVPAAFLLMANPFPLTNHAVARVKFVGWDAVAYLLWCAPLMIWLNFCGGVILTTLFCRHPRRMTGLYAGDLAGAGVGCLLAIGLMKWISPPAAFVAATVPVLVTLLLYDRALRLTGGGGGRVRAVAGLGLLLAGVAGIGPVRLRNFENFRHTGPALVPVRSDWNHLIRTDRFASLYVLDGDASTPLVRWTERERARPVIDPQYAMGLPHPSVAVIGFGGGPEVAEARRAGASSILAIDINPALGRWVLGEDRTENGGLFEAPEIEVVVGDGRQVIRSSGRRFDVIVMHAIDTFAATASGAYALSENFLYTKEAFQDYLAALTDDGVIVISRWLFDPPRENLRLFITAERALRENGVADAAAHLVMIAPVRNPAELSVKPAWGYLMVARRPFSTEALRRLSLHVATRGWTFLHAPGLRTGSPFDAYIDSTDRAAFIASYPYLVSALSDTHPYLFQFYRPLRADAWRGRGNWTDTNIYRSSAVLLPVSLLLAVVLSLGLVLAPLLRRRAAGGGATLLPRQALFFACIGLGYVCVEVPMTQALTLCLGHPASGFAVTLAGLLLSSGAGSLAAGHLRVGKSLPCLAAALAAALLAAGAYPLVHAALSWSEPARLALALAGIAACGFPMGFPLALGVRELGAGNQRGVSWAWAINATASVVGSCAVMVLMVSFGFAAALVTACCCYLVASAAAAGPAARVGA